MNIRIPDEIRIGGHTIKIIYPYKFSERTDICAQYQPALQRIVICTDDGNSNERTDSEIKQTFIHELLHAIDYIYNSYSLSKSEEGDPTVERLSQGLLQVLLENKLQE